MLEPIGLIIALVTIVSTILILWLALKKSELLNSKVGWEKRNLSSIFEQPFNIFQNLNHRRGDYSNLQKELEKKTSLVQNYKSQNVILSNKIKELQANSRANKIQLDRFRSSRQQEKQEASARTKELELNCMNLEESLKDYISRYKEVAQKNTALEKSIEEMLLVNGKQEEMIKRMHDEKVVNEAALRRTLDEMEAELKDLHERLSPKTMKDDDKFRQEIMHFERELSEAGHREQKLASRIKQLKDGLAELFPDLELNDQDGQQDDWIHKYLTALKLLGSTVEELREQHHQSDNKDMNNLEDGKRPMRLTPTRLGGKGTSSRAGTPSSGRSSRASNRDYSNHDKRLIERKLVEDLALFCLRCLD